MKNLTQILLASFCAAALLAGCGDTVSENQTAQEAQPALLAVDVYTVAIRPISNEVSISGRARAYREAEIRPEVNGIIRERLFEEGQFVTKNMALYRIDSARYGAEVASARAGLERAQSAAKLADETLARFKRLVDINAVSQQQYENALAAANQAKADIGIQQATLDRTRIDFNRTTVRSPIDGQIGRSAVNMGALVTQNQAQSLARVLQLDPIYIDMPMPSLRVVEFNRQVRTGEIKLSEDNTADVDIILENGQAYEQRGKIDFAEVSVDEAAGSVILRATIPNPDGALLPGMYLQAKLDAGRFDAAATVPQGAVTRTARGETVVFIASAENLVERRIIETVGNLDNSWIVTDGLNNGEKNHNIEPADVA